jgi:hypothetical protein
VINGSIAPRPPDLALISRRLAHPRIRADLASFEIDDPSALPYLTNIGAAGLDQNAIQKRLDAAGPQVQGSAASQPLHSSNPR